LKGNSSQLAKLHQEHRDADLYRGLAEHLRGHSSLEPFLRFALSRPISNITIKCEDNPQFESAIVVDVWHISRSPAPEAFKGCAKRKLTISQAHPSAVGMSQFLTCSLLAVS